MGREGKTRNKEKTRPRSALVKQALVTARRSLIIVLLNKNVTRPKVPIPKFVNCLTRGLKKENFTSGRLNTFHPNKTKIISHKIFTQIILFIQKKTAKLSNYKL